jgi:hypothetical protein
MPTITISLPSYVTEVEAQPFPEGVSAEVAQTVSLTAGAGSIVVAATGDDWCWRFTEHGPGFSSTRFCTVVGNATYASLVDVDPGTLTSIAEPPSAAWSLALDAVVSPPSVVITYNGDGSVATVTENGVTTTYTYNGDGSVATDIRAGVTRAYTYDGSGNLTGIAVI